MFHFYFENVGVMKGSYYKIRLGEFGVHQFAVCIVVLNVT